MTKNQMLALKNGDRIYTKSGEMLRFEYRFYGNNLTWYDEGKRWYIAATDRYGITSYWGPDVVGISK